MQAGSEPQNKEHSDHIETFGGVNSSADSNIRVPHGVTRDIVAQLVCFEFPQSEEGYRFR